MKVTLNSKEHSLPTPTKLGAFLSSLGLDGKGLAVAVNNTVVPRSQWATHELNDGDQLTVIKAACGG